MCGKTSFFRLHHPAHFVIVLSKYAKSKAFRVGGQVMEPFSHGEPGRTRVSPIALAKKNTPAPTAPARNPPKTLILNHAQGLDGASTEHFYTI